VVRKIDKFPATLRYSYILVASKSRMSSNFRKNHCSHIILVIFNENVAIIATRKGDLGVARALFPVSLHPVSFRSILLRPLLNSSNLSIFVLRATDKGWPGELLTL
jgi:hypothetical protein